jgi:UDP-2-acetamido-2,6-beta-L-arabino-hexul-4-ose reductase
MEKTKKKVGITGPNGFLGKHARYLFSTIPDEIEVVPISIGSMSDAAALANIVKNLDVIVHFARFHPNDVASPEELYSKNVELARSLISACEISASLPYIIFASSTQIRKDNPYGKAKKDSGRMFAEWAAKSGGISANLIIPNEFGEGAVPGRISVVSTFCVDLIENRESKITEGATVALIHAQDIIKEILALIRDPKSGDMELVGSEMGIDDLYRLLSGFKQSYYSDIIPALRTHLELCLFNNFRYHVFQTDFYPKKLILRTDDRGSLFEMIKEHTGGQTFASSTKPGITRGNHFHTRKIERFCVIKGQAEISLREVGTKEVRAFVVSGDEPVYIDMPTFYSHNIKNIGKEELLTLFWSNEIFDPSDPDTFYLTV